MSRLKGGGRRLYQHPGGGAVDGVCTGCGKECRSRAVERASGGRTRWCVNASVASLNAEPEDGVNDVQQNPSVRTW
jgi:hypothetical protein